MRRPDPEARASMTQYSEQQPVSQTPLVGVPGASSPSPALAADIASTSARRDARRRARPVAVTVWRHVDGDVARVVEAIGGSALLGADDRLSPPARFELGAAPAGRLRRGIVGEIDGRIVVIPGESGGAVIRWTRVARPSRAAAFLVRASSPVWRRRSQRALDALRLPG